MSLSYVCLMNSSLDQPLSLLLGQKKKKKIISRFHRRKPSTAPRFSWEVCWVCLCPGADPELNISSFLMRPWFGLPTTRWSWSISGIIKPSSSTWENKYNCLASPATACPAWIPCILRTVKCCDLYPCHTTQVCLDNLEKQFRQLVSVCTDLIQVGTVRVGDALQFSSN